MRLILGGLSGILVYALNPGPSYVRGQRSEIKIEPTKDLNHLSFL